MLSLAGKSALITGASRGIGLAISRLFAQAGASVTMLSRDEPTLAQAAATVDRARWIAGDATDLTAIDAAVDTACEATGRIDILVNNAGGSPPTAPLMTIPIERFDEAIAFNLRAPLLMTRQVWGRSMRAQGGVVLNIASIGGLSLPRGMGAYSAAKAGLLHLTRLLAAELGPGIRVNAIAPGVVETDATAAVPYEAFGKLLPMERVGQPADIARAALFLCSDQAGWITGETLVVDGGTLVQQGRLKPGWDDARDA